MENVCAAHDAVERERPTQGLGNTPAARGCDGGLASGAAVLRVMTCHRGHTPGTRPLCSPHFPPRLFPLDFPQRPPLSSLRKPEPPGPAFPNLLLKSTPPTSCPRHLSEPLLRPALNFLVFSRPGFHSLAARPQGRGVNYGKTGSFSSMTRYVKGQFNQSDVRTLGYRRVDVSSSNP